MGWKLKTADVMDEGWLRLVVVYKPLFQAPVEAKVFVKAGEGSVEAFWENGLPVQGSALVAMKKHVDFFLKNGDAWSRRETFKRIQRKRAI